ADAARDWLGAGRYGSRRLYADHASQDVVPAQPLHRHELLRQRLIQESSAGFAATLIVPLRPGRHPENRPVDTLLPQLSHHLFLYGRVAGDSGIRGPEIGTRIAPGEEVEHHVVDHEKVVA